MKKKIISIVLFAALSMFIVPMGVYARQNEAWAEEHERTSIKAETVYTAIQKMLGKTVLSMTDMKNVDGNDVFLYINFSEGGYAVFLKDTFEMLEYSPSGQKELSKNTDTYYVGPNCYCIKKGAYFYDINESRVISVDADRNSEFITKSFSHERTLSPSFYSGRWESPTSQTRMTEIRNNTPPYNNANRIFADYSSGKFIDNYYYFANLPYHGENKHGTCGSVAAQLLLSYNNYFNDRRIIIDNATYDYLFGDATTDSEENPNTCSDPVGLGFGEDTSCLLGSTDAYYNYIIGEIEPDALSCHHDTEGTNCIHVGSSYSQVLNGIDDILNVRRSAGVSYSVTGNDPPFNRFPMIQPNTPTMVDIIPNLFRYIPNTIYPRSSFILFMIGIITKADNTAYRAIPIPIKAIFLFLFIYFIILND